jgi:hypothetical protein
VTVDEITLMINIALGATSVDMCPAGDVHDDGRIDISDLCWQSEACSAAAAAG